MRLLLTASVALALLACGSTHSPADAPAPSEGPPSDPMPADPASSPAEPAPAPAPADPTPAEPGVIDLAQLYAGGTWVHAREQERAGGDRIFWPERRGPFPRSRFRMKYRFAADGACAWMWLAPNDAHRMKPARCEIDAATGVIRFMEGGAEAHRLTVISLTTDELRAR